MRVKPIVFNDFKAEYRELKKELSPAIKRVFQSGQFLLGMETASFEHELAGKLGVQYAVTVANGTEALAIALLLCDVKPGDEVIVPALTAYPTVIGVQMAHGVAVVCDVDLETGLLDPTQLLKLITPKTKAIVPVHLFGQMCQMKEIAVIADAHSIAIVEDCAQSILATQDGKMAGSFSTVASLSFYPSKNLGAYGDAGAVITNDPILYDRAKKVRQYGQSTRYVHDEFGFNSRIDELQAAVLRVKLPKVSRWIERRREIENIYRQELKIGRQLQSLTENYHTFHLFVTRMSQREKFMQYCESNQLPVIIHYPKTVYQQPAFRFGRFNPCPNAERLVEEIISLPIHPYLTDREVMKICKIVNSFIE